MNKKLREDMMVLKGMMEAIRFPLHWINEQVSQPFYDLLDNIGERYDSIISELFDDTTSVCAHEWEFPENLQVAYCKSCGDFGPQSLIMQEVCPHNLFEISGKKVFCVRCKKYFNKEDV